MGYIRSPGFAQRGKAFVERIRWNRRIIKSLPTNGKGANQGRQLKSLKVVHFIIVNVGRTV
jgi:hypothetical protein